jgi:hypothetical protein
MHFLFDHNNINVLDLERSISFYKEALGLTWLRDRRIAKHLACSSDLRSGRRGAVPDRFDLSKVFLNKWART